MSNTLWISRFGVLLLFSTIFFIAGGQITLLGGQVYTKSSDPSMIATYLNPAQQEMSRKISAVGGPFSLYSTNGNKIVSDFTKTLHCVFVDVDTIKYSESTDALNWSTPISISPSGSKQPTIAVTNNFVGVAYIKSNGGLFYTFKPLNGSWHTPVSISLITEEQDPSMVSYGLNMHLTWASSSSIEYVSFPANLTATPASIESYINPTTLCGTWRAEIPSIAVTQTSASDLTPLVRVSYYSFNLTCQSQNDGFGFLVSQRPSGPPTGNIWPVVLGGIDFSFANLSNTGRVSNSMCANPATGDFYIGTSALRNGVGSTELLYENAWNPTDPWRSVQLLPRRSLIHVNTGGGFFHIAVSDFTLGSGGYGPTWIRTGTWVKPTAPGPTWKTGMFQISSNARDPQVIFWREVLSPISSTRLLQAIYDEQSGNTYTLKQMTLNAPSQ